MNIYGLLEESGKLHKYRNLVREVNNLKTRKIIDSHIIIRK